MPTFLCIIGVCLFFGGISGPDIVPAEEVKSSLAGNGFLAILGVWLFYVGWKSRNG